MCLYRSVPIWNNGSITSEVNYHHWIEWARSSAVDIWRLVDDKSSHVWWHYFNHQFGDSQTMLFGDSRNRFAVCLFVSNSWNQRFMKCDGLFSGERTGVKLRMKPKKKREREKKTRQRFDCSQHKSWNEINRMGWKSISGWASLWWLFVVVVNDCLMGIKST